VVLPNAVAVRITAGDWNADAPEAEKRRMLAKIFMVMDVSVAVVRN
jgi:hypothetical protein